MFPCWNLREDWILQVSDFAAHFGQSMEPRMHGRLHRNSM
jgi:hypothetical protein